MLSQKLPPSSYPFKIIAATVLLALWSVFACDRTETRSMTVTATAYNSLPAQTDPDHPTTTAWGDELKPGMRAIAVSRDLIAEGLTHNTAVEIEGLPGKYRVLDKMHARWNRKIDIYMGNDENAAREWGRKEVTISWEVDPEAESE